MGKSKRSWQSIGIETLDVAALKVDPTYQRKVTTNLKALVDAFDERKLGLIHVSRRADETLWIIDGQHRWEACRALGRKTMRCEVYEGATVEDEAAIFDGLNNTKSVDPFYKFRARVRAGAEAEVAIEQLFASRGQSIIGERFRAPKCAEWFYEGCGGMTVNGPEVLAWAVDVYLMAWPSGPLAAEAKSHVDGVLLKGIAVVGAHYGDRVPAGELAKKLSGITSNAVKANALQMMGGPLWSRVAFVVVNRFNHKRTARHLVPQWVIGTRPKTANGVAAQP